MNKTLKLKQTKANKQKFWSPLLDLWVTSGKSAK